MHDFKRHSDTDLLHEVNKHQHNILLKGSHFYTYSANSIKTVQKWFQYKFASILITVSWQINITFEQLTKEIQQ